MGFFSDTDPGFRQDIATATPLPPRPPDASEAIPAAFRQSNIVASTWNALANSGDFAPDPTHNPLDTIRGSKYEQRHLDNFVGSRSEAETRSIMRRIDGEEADEKTLQAAGAGGVALSMLAGVIDPTILLPGTIAVRAGRGGLEFSRAAVNVGVAGALQSSVQETLLHATQETRTLEESLVSIAAGTLLAGIIGGGASQLLTPVGRKQLTDAIEKVRADMDAHASPAPKVQFKTTHGDVLETGKRAFEHEVQSVDGQRLGHISGVESDDAVRVIRSGIEASARSQGIGSAAYENLVDYAIAKGKRFESDVTVSPAAARVYDRLAEKGYQVERNPTAKLEDADEWNEGVVSFKGSDGKPVFTITAGPSRQVPGGAPPLAPEPRKPLPAGATISPTVWEGGRDLVTGAPIPQTAKKTLTLDGEVLAEVNLLKIDGEPYIQSIQTFPGHQRKGYATALMDDIYREFPGANIKTSMQTRDGAPFFRAYGDGSLGRPLTDTMSVAPPSGLGVAAPAGAAATDIRTLEMPSSIPGTSRISTTRRTMEAESVVARRAMADTAETPYSYKQSTEGVAATQGPPVDRVVKMAKDGGMYEVGQELDRLFTEYRFGQNAPPLASYRAGFDDLMGRGEGKMSYGDFKRAVSEAMMFGDRHEIPQVAAAAQFIRAKLEPWTARAEQAVEGFKRLEPAPGETYFPHSWNKEKIRAQRPVFTDRLTELYKADQQTKAAAKERLGKLNDDLNKAEDALAKAKSPEEAAAAKSIVDDLRARVEGEIAAWEGKSVSEAKAAIKAREKYAADTNRAEENIGRGPVNRLESADSAINLAVKRILASDRDLSDQELRSVAQQTVDRILGSPDGRLPYDAVTSSRGSAFGGEDARGALAKRQLNVPNAWAREWVEDDIEHVVNSHLRTVVPDVVLAERHGDAEMSAVMRAVQEDYARLIDAAGGNEKKATALGKERDAVIRDLAGVRDRIRGTYGYNPGMENLGRITTALKQVNNLTSMGMSAIASIADFAGAPIRYGLTTAFKDGWAPFLANMVKANPALEKQRSQLKALGIGVDTALNIRQHAMDDIIDGYKPQSRVERALQWTNDKFFVANMLAPLTDVQKRIAGSVAINEALRGVKAIHDGKATKAQIRNLADAGIDANMAERIHRQFFESKFGETVDGVHVPNTGDWTDRAAKEAFEGAIGRDVDIMVISPGQEKPLLMSQPIGSLLLQFKSFPAAATERILISNLQRRDAAALSGIMTSIALGMLSYKINSMLGGQPVSERPQDWVKEGISRSGIIGWLEEGNAMAAKLTRGTLDVHRLYGADKPLSRYASRSLADAFLGPTAGKLAGIGQVGGAAASGEWNQSDTTALRRLMFFQNLAYLRGLINQVESGVNESLGIPERAAR